MPKLRVKKPGDPIKRAKHSVKKEELKTPKEKKLESRLKKAKKG